MEPLQDLKNLQPQDINALTPQAPTPMPLPNITGAIKPDDSLAGLRSIGSNMPMPGSQYAPQKKDEDLPIWADMLLGAAVYGGTALALGAATGGIGALGTAAVAAPIYLAVKYALTGHKPQADILSKIPGSENINPVVLGTVEETAMWMATGPLLKGGGKVVKGLAKGVDMVLHKPIAGIVKAAEPAGEWLWHTISIPTKAQIPGVGKSLQEMVIPAVERMEKSLPEASKLFRNTAVDKTLIVDAASILGNKLQAETPEVIAQVGKSLKTGAKATNARARELISDFRSTVKDIKLDKKYSTALTKELGKMTMLPSKVSAKMVEVLEQETSNVGNMYKALKEVIRNPETPEKMRVLAKDIWNLPARTPMAVAGASREASKEYLVSKVKKMPGVISDTLKSGYVESKVPSLKGLIIHRDIEHEFLAMDKLPKIADSAFNKFFMSPWKTAKVILRPASHFRNAISNAILNDWGGLPFYRTDVYMDAIKGMKDKALSWKEFSRMTGATASNFSTADLNQIASGTTYGSNIIEKGLNLFDKIVKPARSFYAAEESMFKYAKYLHNIEKGLGKQEAAFDAVKWTFNFSEVTPEVANVGKYAMPFVRWYSKAIPLGLETAVKHPVRMGKWLAFAQAFQANALEQTGISDEEWETTQKMLPDYMQKGMYMLMPWRDDKGQLQMFDLTYMMPFFGDLSELYRQSPQESILQNPVFTMASTLISKKKFSGAPLYYDWEPNNTKFMKTMAYGWEQLSPAIAPGGTDWNKMYKAINEAEGSLSTEQAMANLIGMKLTPVDQMANIRRKRAIRDIYERELRGSYKGEIKRSKEEERPELLEKYQNLYRNMNK